MIIKPPPGTIVAVYARTDHKEQTADPVHDQLTRNLDYALSQRWKVAASYTDAGCSGTTFVDRTGWYAMVRAARRGEFALLLVEELDRVSSDPEDIRLLTEVLPDYGVTLYSIAAAMNFEAFGSDLEGGLGAVVDLQTYREGIASGVVTLRPSMPSGEAPR